MSYITVVPSLKKGMTKPFPKNIPTYLKIKFTICTSDFYRRLCKNTNRTAQMRQPGDRYLLLTYASYKHFVCHDSTFGFNITTMGVLGIIPWVVNSSDTKTFLGVTQRYIKEKLKLTTSWLPPVDVLSRWYSTKCVFLRHEVFEP